MTRRRHFDLPPLAPLEAFEAAARHLSFTRAADELALTQSAVSRQVAALEAFYGVALFQRLHRALRLTEAGRQLQGTVADALQQLHLCSAALRGATRPKTVVVTTTPGFAGLWLIPRLACFTATHADVDVRISASYARVDLDRDGVDVAVRYQTEASRDGKRLFGEVVLPVCSPRLRRDAARPLRQPADLRHHCLLHLDSVPGGHLLEWPLWLRAMKLEGLKPAGALHFSQYDQLIQSAVAGQGVALGRLPLLDAMLVRRELVAPFSKGMASPRSFYLCQSEASRHKPEVRDFLAWLEAEATRADVSG